MRDIVLGNELLKQICEKIGIDYNLTRRVVLDIPYDDVVTVYVEKLGTKALLDIDLQSDIKIVEVGNHAD